MVEMRSMKMYFHAADGAATEVEPIDIGKEIMMRRVQMWVNSPGPVLNLNAQMEIWRGLDLARLGGDYSR